MRIVLNVFWLLCLIPHPGAQASLFALTHEPHQACAVHIAHHERLKGIPRHLLAAIAKVESGRTDKISGKFVAWPWTINVNGEGFVFKTKEEAIRAVRRFQSQGQKSIDVGCMQVNLHHHPKAFKSLEEAFDPRKNVDYAAKFLSDLRDSHHSWTQAVAHYHSATPKHHIPYRKKVYQFWQKERKQKPDEMIGHMDDMLTGNYSADSRPTTWRPVNIASRIQPMPRAFLENRPQRSSSTARRSVSARLAQYRQRAQNTLVQRTQAQGNVPRPVASPVMKGRTPLLAKNRYNIIRAQSRAIQRP